MDNNQQEQTLEELMEEIRKAKEEAQKPKFRMDENGNLERIDKNE